MPKVHFLTAEDLIVGSSTANALKQAVQTDLEEQKKAAEVALAEARKIEAVLESGSTENPLLNLKNAKDAFLKVARILAANTTATSTTVLDIVSSGQPSKPR